MNNGWVAIVAYHNGVIFAGRDLTVQDNVGTISAPGSNPGEYSDSQLDLFVPSEQVDLQAGRGLRAYEEIRDLRQHQQIDFSRPVKFYDPNSGIYRTQYGKYLNEYTFHQLDEVVFAVIDVGRNWSDAFDPYTSWRDWTRKIPLDTVGQRVNFRVWKFFDESLFTRYATSGLSIEAFSAETETISEVTSDQLVSHQNTLKVSFEDTGIYVIKALYEPLDGYSNPVLAQDYFGGEIIVNIIPKSSFDHSDASLLDQDIKRAQIELHTNVTFSEHDRYQYLMGAFEIKTDPNTRAIDYYAFKFKDLLSIYQYVVGPRASDGYTQRFGSASDFNRDFAWDLVMTDGSTNRYHTAASMPSEGLGPFSLGQYVPKDWNNTFYRHVSSNIDLEKDLGFTHISRDLWEHKGSMVALSKEPYQPNLGGVDIWGHAFAPQNLRFLRWFPWIAETPTEGFRINLWVKTANNLATFFNGDGLGQSAWSGHGPQIPNTTTGAEYWSPVPDSARDGLETTYDIAYGRTFLIPRQTLRNVKKVVLYNVNPGYTNLITKAAQTGPDFIYLDEYIVVQ